MNYYKFFTSNYKILLFGISLTFFSAFGQTFLLALYIPEIIEEFDITRQLYSTLYAVATLISGFTIIFAGKIIDKRNLKTFTLWIVAGFIVANILAGLASNLVMLVLAIFTLRFFGQGMSTHTAATAMGRYFSRSRGKALSLMHLGFPFAETIFPISVVTLITIVGWRNTFFLSAALIALVLLPLVLYFLHKFTAKNIVELPADKIEKKQEAPISLQYWSQRKLMRSLFFYLIAPSVFLVGFLQTALFFYQVYIAEFKGWSREWMALSITAFAVSSLLSSILTGPLCDRFTARRVFPYVLIPLASGLLLVSAFSHPATAMVMWFLVGITGGANPTTTNAMYAEIFGTRSLGSIRSVFTFVMVVSTALGPVVYSLFLENGYNFNFIHILSAMAIFLNILWIMLVFRKVKVT